MPEAGILPLKKACKQIIFYDSFSGSSPSVSDYTADGSGHLCLRIGRDGRKALRQYLACLPENRNTRIPEGYFQVVVTASDGRVRDVRCLLFKSSGEFVKERHLVTPSDPVSSWPLKAIREPLPKGSSRTDPVSRESEAGKQMLNAKYKIFLAQTNRIYRVLEPNERSGQICL